MPTTLMKAVGITAEEIDIRPAAKTMLDDIGHPFAAGEPVYDTVFENVQAGLRTDYLFRLAGQHKGFVLGTGDLSELALGWCTYGVGDQMSHYGVNSGVPKTLIQYLIRWAERTNQFDPATDEVLEAILATEITPELVPADADGAVQSTQSLVGPYELNDFFLHHFMRYGLKPSKVAYLAYHAWKDRDAGLWPPEFPDGEKNQYDLPTIRFWLEKFLRRFFQFSQFKRSAMPNGPKVSSGGALSPRGDWRAPSDAVADVWLAELRDGLPDDECTTLLPERAGRLMAIVNAIATALPALDFEQDFRRWVRASLAGTRQLALYERMINRSGIDHRWSVLSEDDAHLHRGKGLYGDPDMPPGTGARMSLYERHAPDLALQAIANLPDGAFDAAEITHIVVASCTGFVAPGVDQIIARRLGLNANVERTLIGFMGCYAAVTSLRTARHIVRSQPDAKVLVVTVELSSLHHQSVTELGPLMAISQFGDGAAAAIVSGSGAGLQFDGSISVAMEDSDELIQWHIGDHGFEMELSGEVPGRIAHALSDRALRDRLSGGETIDSWAVHAGGPIDTGRRHQGAGPSAQMLSIIRAMSCGNAAICRRRR